MSSHAPRYGTPNVSYVRTWFGGTDEKAMWALNLMKYRAIADYQDGRDVNITGAEADMLYMPDGPLNAIGGRVMMAAEVVHRLRGDSIEWDMVAVAFYPRRMAMLEMQMLPEFIDLHVHKDAAMDFTIVMATMPTADSPAPADWSALSEGDMLLMQVVADATTADLAELVPSRRIGIYDVDGVIVGDERAWMQARWDIISRDDVATLTAAFAANDDPSVYAMILEPRLDVMNDPARGGNNS